MVMTMAAGQVEDPVAGDAGEVVVMALAGDLVAGPLSGQVDAGEPALIDQGFDGAVHRRLADPGQAFAGTREDFLRRQRPALVLEDGADRLALRGLSLHRHVRESARARGGSTLDREEFAEAVEVMVVPQDHEDVLALELVVGVGGEGDR